MGIEGDVLFRSSVPSRPDIFLIGRRRPFGWCFISLQQQPPPILPVQTLLL